MQLAVVMCVFSSTLKEALEIQKHWKHCRTSEEINVWESPTPDLKPAEMLI